ncbi:hypothetical protein GF339_18775 [candidate division KSB3 bacterium]|uniref:Uncharacterized protein n=1 Tax=candidate division KSB3 bacterium TaxID=2044937 RepID=A0A9D5JYR4_9BACT|nr:hypothetical protein [candidate division KSB3 bacterium]MBD3326635.1 hypothetical protein [candidate division KSB3 bacterium]
MRQLYEILTKNEVVYLFYLVPIIYFASIIVRLIYYKLKYQRRLSYPDVMAGATMLIIVLDYINYLYLLITGTGKVLPIGALLIKYTLGFLLWIWMFWYSYKVYLKRNFTATTLKRWRMIIVCVGSMALILIVIGLVAS